MNVWRVEPVAIASAALIALQMCCVYWWKLDAARTAEIMAGATTIVGLITRQSVTSPDTIHKAGETVSGLVARAAENTLAARTANGYPPLPKPLPDPPPPPPKVQP